MGDGGRQVEALVKVEVDAESGLIDSEEPPQPAAVEDHARVTIREADTPVCFASLPAYSATPETRNSRSDNRPIRSRPSATSRSISACRCRCRALGARRRPRTGPKRGSNGTSRTHSDTLLLDTQPRGDLGQRQPRPPRLARLLPLGELAPVAHGRILA